MVYIDFCYSGVVLFCLFVFVVVFQAVIFSNLSHLGSNPQYSLKIHSPVHKPLVWVLLTRHITTKVSNIILMDYTHIQYMYVYV